MFELGEHPPESADGCRQRKNRACTDSSDCGRLEWPEMPDLSQRTLAHVMRVLGELVPEDANTYPLRRDFWKQLLFQWGFPNWLIEGAAGLGFDWTTIIRDLFEGRMKEQTGQYTTYLIPQILQHSVLNKLTAMAITESEETEETHRLRRSLQLDGFDVSDGKTVPIEGPVSVTEEKSRLLANLAASSFARKDLIAKHLKDAEDLFSEGKMHPAMGQARSAFEAGVEDFVALVEINTNRKAGSGLKNQIQFLSKGGFISADEEQAFLSA